jgi:hypothetical protein
MSAHQDDIDRDYFSDEGEECWQCGGSGVLDDECTCGEDTCCCLVPSPPPCPECLWRARIAERREELRILKEIDVDAARAMLLRRRQRGHNSRDLLLMIHCSRVASPHFTDSERADSACWVEGLL